MRRIEQVSATRVGVSAEMGMTIEIDGSNTQFGQIDLAIGGTIKIGPFLLRVLPPELGSRGRRRSTSSAPTPTRTTTSSTPAASRCRA